MKNINLILATACTLALLSSPSRTAVSAEYIYRELMGNTLPPQKCSSHPEASAKASDPYHIDRYAKTFCEVQGYGWHVSDQKNNGKLVCEPCKDGNRQDKFQCHREDVVVSCKRIRPGSVGLFPGAG